MEKKLLEIINVVLENRGRKPISKIKAKQLLRDEIGLDSLDLAELTVRIEAEYDIDIFEDGLVNTIGEILEKLETK